MVRQSSQGQGQRANQDFSLGVVTFVLFFFLPSGGLASLLQEFDWIGSSNRQ